MKIPRWLATLALVGTLAFWIGAVAVPLWALFARISTALPGRAQSGVWSVFWDADVRSVAGATARQALWSAFFSMLIGLPLGLAAARATGRMARALDTLLLLPQGVPTVVAATAWVAWLGRSGVLARWDLAYSLSAVVIAHVFFNAPWVALVVAQARRGMPLQAYETAATLGAGRWARWRWVTWPELRWALGAAGAQTIAVCAMSFALVMILGGGPPVETLETALYARLRGGGLDLSGAAACAAWEILLTLPPWMLLLVMRGRNRKSALPSQPEHRDDVGAAMKSGVWSGLASLGAFVLFIPYLIIFADGGLSAWFTAAFWEEAFGPLRLSAIIAICAAFGAVGVAALGTLAVASISVRGRAILGALLALPSGLSVLVLGLGGWLAYGRWVDPFEGSLGAIIALQVTVFFPLAFRLLWPVAQASPRSALEAAYLLGASPVRAFWLVESPRWRAPLFSAFALVGGMAVGEVAAVSLFYSEDLIPLPLLVARWLGQYRFEEARAVSALLFVGAMGMMAVVAALGAATERFRGRNLSGGRND